MTILVFDSGIGGLTVLREARVVMPFHRFVYVADDAGFPYGDWAEEALRTRIISLFDGLLQTWQPDVVIIACNTASTIAIAALRAAYPGQTFVGTVPAIKPAAERTRSGLISVLATPGTVRRDYTQDLIRSYGGGCAVKLVGSANLAALAETYMRGGMVDEAAVAAEIAPCFIARDSARTDIVVMACTHFPFLVNRMRKLAPWPVDWIDPAEAIARRAAGLAHEQTATDAAHHAVFISGPPDALTKRLLTGFGLTAI